MRRAKNNLSTTSTPTLPGNRYLPLRPTDRSTSSRRKLPSPKASPFPPRLPRSVPHRQRRRHIHRLLLQNAIHGCDVEASGDHLRNQQIELPGHGVCIKVSRDGYSLAATGNRIDVLTADGIPDPEGSRRTSRLRSLAWVGLREDQPRESLVVLRVGIVSVKWALKGL